MANHELVSQARLAKMAMQEQRMELAIINAGMQSFFAKRARHDAELHTRMFGMTLPCTDPPTQEQIASFSIVNGDGK